MSDPGSVTLWLGRLQSGDRDAVQKLWERFFHRLVGLARQKLGNLPRAAADEEDVALSAFDSFFWAAEKGRFPKLCDRHDLWVVLMVITTRKAADRVKFEHQQKRDCRRCEPSGNPQGVKESPFASIIGKEPDPALAAEMVERCRILLDKLGDDELRTIALRKLEGYSNQEIASELDCAVATVERRLRLVRESWWDEQMP
jgi:DNA-directed RNA polymerase specialized sigma24 family protein